MNRKLVLSALFWAATAGGLVALVTGDRQAVSLRMWLGGFALWFSVATLAGLLQRVPLAQSSLRPAFARRSSQPVRTGSQLRQVRAIESLLLRARDIDRAHTQQLKPRLAAMADHYLPVIHGIDRRLEPARTKELLGDLSWLIAEDASPGTPTIAQVDEFVTRLTTPVRARSDADAGASTRIRSEEVV